MEGGGDSAGAAAVASATTAQPKTETLSLEGGKGGVQLPSAVSGDGISSTSTSKSLLEDGEGTSLSGGKMSKKSTAGGGGAGSGEEVEEAIRKPLAEGKKRGGKDAVDEVRKGLEKVVVDDDDDEDEEKDPLADLTPAQKQTVEELKGVQEKYRDLWKEYVVEWNALKAKYEEKYQPLYLQRQGILLKTPADSSNEVAKGTQALPKFWLRVFQNCRAIASTIEPQDIPVLEYLEDLNFSWEDVQKQDTFTLMFTFSKNPYFEQTIVSKRYVMSTQPGDDTPSLDKIEGTELKWFEGQDVTKRVLLRKQRNKRTKQIRIVEEPRDRQSFFHFFATRDVPSDEDLIEMDADEVAEFEMLFQADYDLGVLMRDKIVPKAVLWFTGEEEEDDDDDYDDDDDDDEDDDDDDDDDDSEPEEETRRSGTSRVSHGARQGGARKGVRRG